MIQHYHHFRTFSQLCDRRAISYKASLSSVFTISPSQLPVQVNIELHITLIPLNQVFSVILTFHRLIHELLNVLQLGGVDRLSKHELLEKRREYNVVDS